MDPGSPPGTAPQHLHLSEAAIRPATRLAAPAPGFFSSGRSPSSPPALPPGVSYLPLELQQLPEDVKEQLRGAAEALKKTGSLAGGRRTHEFAQVDYFVQQLREKGWGRLLQQLAITPTDLAGALGHEFLLVGADLVGKEVGQLGRAGLYQVLRSHGQQWVELSEEQLDVLSGDGTVIAPEMINGQVGEYPATIEHLTDHRGEVLINLQWIVRNRSLFLTTKNMQAEQSLGLARAITRGIEAMPHEGWRVPYAYDGDNPLHRITRARWQQARPGEDGVRR